LDNLFEIINVAKNREGELISAFVPPKVLKFAGIDKDIQG